jgi:hypothetical protein
MTMPDYQIDPHLRHDFSPPPPLPRQTRYGYQPGHVPLGPPPWLRRTRAWFRLRRTRLRTWWHRREYRLGRWLSRRLPYHPGAETAALQLLVLALTAVVLFQAVLLVLTTR